MQNILFRTTLLFFSKLPRLLSLLKKLHEEMLYPQIGQNIANSSSIATGIMGTVCVTRFKIHRFVISAPIFDRTLSSW